MNASAFDDRQAAEGYLAVTAAEAVKAASDEKKKNAIEIALATSDAARKASAALHSFLKAKAAAKASILMGKHKADSGLSSRSVVVPNGHAEMLHDNRAGKAWHKAALKMSFANKVKKKAKIKSSEIDSFTDNAGKEIFMMTFEPKPKPRKDDIKGMERRWVPGSETYHEETMKHGKADDKNLTARQSVRPVAIAQQNKVINDNLTNALNLYEDAILANDDNYLRNAEENAWEAIRRFEEECRHDAWIRKPEPVVLQSQMCMDDIYIEAHVAASHQPAWKTAQKCGVLVRPSPHDFLSQEIQNEPFMKWWQCNTAMQRSARNEFLEAEIAAAAVDADVIRSAHDARITINRGDATSTKRLLRNRWRLYRKWYFLSDPPVVRRRFLRNEADRLSRAWGSAWVSWRRWLDIDYRDNFCDGTCSSPISSNDGCCGCGQLNRNKDQRTFQLRAFSPNSTSLQKEFAFERKWGTVSSCVYVALELRGSINVCCKNNRKSYGVIYPLKRDV